MTGLHHYDTERKFWLTANAAGATVPVIDADERVMFSSKKKQTFYTVYQ